jgi:putative membrane protein
MRLILHWLLSALALIIVAYLVPGFEISGGIKTALIAALVFGLVNSTLGFLLKILTFPFILLTLGLFWFVINAFMLMFASRIVSGFHVHGFLPAFIGAIVLSLVNMLLRSLFTPKREYPVAR